MLSKKHAVIIKRVVAVALVLACIISISMTLTVSAATTHSLSYNEINSSKVYVTLRASSNTILIINPLQCRTKSGSDYSYVRDTNNTGSGTSIGAIVTPGTGWTLVQSNTYNYTKYKVGSGSEYSIDYYW
mgnify:CR=1 FL=1